MLFRSRPVLGLLDSAMVMNRIALLVATVCGVGYAPVAPGTFGSAAGLLVWWALPGGAVSHITRGAPEMPAFSDSVPRSATTPGMPGLMSKLDVRLHPDDVGFATGTPSGSALVRGWCAFRDGRTIDAHALTLLCDALPPAMFNISGAPGWVPTVHLSLYLRGVPAPGPVMAEFTTDRLHDGIFEEDGLLWDSTGALVAQSRQLALLPR